MHYGASQGFGHATRCEPPVVREFLASRHPIGCVEPRGGRRRELDRLRLLELLGAPLPSSGERVEVPTNDIRVVGVEMAVPAFDLLLDFACREGTFFALEGRPESLQNEDNPIILSVVEVQVRVGRSIQRVAGAAAHDLQDATTLQRRDLGGEAVRGFVIGPALIGISDFADFDAAAEFLRECPDELNQPVGARTRFGCRHVSALQTRTRAGSVARNLVRCHAQPFGDNCDCFLARVLGLTRLDPSDLPFAHRGEVGLGKTLLEPEPTK